MELSESVVNSLVIFGLKHSVREVTEVGLLPKEMSRS